MPITEDASTPAVVQVSGSTSGSTAVTASFSPPAGSLLVAIAAIGYQTSTATPTVSLSDSVSGSWLQNGGFDYSTAGSIGTAMWTRQLSGAPGSMTVTFSTSTAGTGSDAVDLLLALRVVNGAAASQAGAGTAHGSTGTTNPVAENLTVGNTGSWVYFAGTTLQSTMTPETSSATISGFGDSTTSNQLESGRQASTSGVGSTGAILFGWTSSSTGNAFTFTGLEILPAPPGATGAVTLWTQEQHRKRRGSRRPPQQQMFTFGVPVNPSTTVTAGIAVATATAMDTSLGLQPLVSPTDASGPPLGDAVAQPTNFAYPTGTPAAAAGVAEPPVPHVTVTAQPAAASGVAQQATITSVPGNVAFAGLAGATAVPQTPQPSVTVIAQPAMATGAAQQPVFLLDKGRIHGKSGVAYLSVLAGQAASPVAFLSGWEIDYAQTPVDTTVLDDIQHLYTATQIMETGSFTGFYDTATAQTYRDAVDGQPRNLYLYPDRANFGQFFSGQVIADYSVSGSVTDAVKVTVTWAAAGPVTKTD